MLDYITDSHKTTMIRSSIRIYLEFKQNKLASFFRNRFRINPIPYGATTNLMHGFDDELPYTVFRFLIRKYTYFQMTIKSQEKNSACRWKFFSLT